MEGPRVQSPRAHCPCLERPCMHFPRVQGPRVQGPRVQCGPEPTGGRNTSDSQVSRRSAPAPRTPHPAPRTLQSRLPLGRLIFSGALRSGVAWAPPVGLAEYSAGSGKRALCWPSGDSPPSGRCPQGQDWGECGVERDSGRWTGLGRDEQRWMEMGRDEWRCTEMDQAGQRWMEVDRSRQRRTGVY